jgi:hypothetical protein
MYVNRALVIILSFSLFLQAGCSAKGFHREDLQEQLAVTHPVFDETDIKEAFNKKPNLPRQFKLGVYFRPPQQSYYKSTQAWRWNDQDKTVMDDIARDLKQQGLVADVFPILNSVVQSDDLKSLRLVAAKHQADAILIISGVGEVERYANRWAWTYFLLAPTLFVPGSVAETLFITSASLWDVKNEYLYLTAESEGVTKDTYAALFGKDDKVLIDEAKAQSLNGLKVQITKIIEGTKL